MKKKDALRRWQELPENLPILPHFTPIAADARGSTFGACGIRISGNPEFIDAVLSRLKDLLSAEAGSTRLTLSRSDVKPVFDKQWGNADTDAETCYVQIRERTAKTRQRKVREQTDALPNLDVDEPQPLAEVKKEKPSPKKKIEEKAAVKRPDSGLFIVDDIGNNEDE